MTVTSCRGLPDEVHLLYGGELVLPLRVDLGQAAQEVLVVLALQSLLGVVGS